jgi:hypothetical protein
MEEAGAVRKPIVVPPAQGRVYAMGRMRAIFKADSDESAVATRYRNGGLSLALGDRKYMRTRRTTCSSSLQEP